MIDIYVMQMVALLLYLFFYKSIGIANAVDDVPAGDAGLDRDEGQRYIPKMLAGMCYQLLKEDEYFFRMSAITQIVVAGIDDDRVGTIVCHQPVEEPYAGCQRRAAKTQVDWLIFLKVLVQRFPQPDGAAAVEYHLWFIFQACPFLFQALHFMFVPDHVGVLLLKFNEGQAIYVGGNN